MSLTNEESATYHTANRVVAFIKVLIDLFPEVDAWNMYMSDIYAFSRRWNAQSAISKDAVR
jgi:hypothetical protein